jgi:NAD(P)-dependent dehydrogenase (short-subunit alcohol dehydrogenase family)
MKNNITVLITGSTDGIGKQTALEIAKEGAKVILHGRNKFKAEKTKDEIVSQTKNHNIEFVIADLSSLNNVRKLANEIIEKYKNLNVLINNAAVYMNKMELTEDGLEMTFVVNHLAPFLLTTLLLNLLKNSAPSRIINVSSMTHQRGNVDFDNLQGEKFFDGYDAYSISKLGNIFFTYELAEQLKGSGVTVNCLHPGIINTKLLRAGYNVKGDNVSKGAETPVYLAVSDEVKNVTGKYFVNKKEIPSSALSYDLEIRKKFMSISLKLAGLDKF